MKGTVSEVSTAKQKTGNPSRDLASSGLCGVNYTGI